VNAYIKTYRARFFNFSQLYPRPLNSRQLPVPLRLI
jgi:hypothetical protein